MNNKKLLIILGVVLAVALVVAGVLFFMTQKQEVPANNLNNTNPSNGGQLPSGGETSNNQPVNGNINTNKPAVDPAEQAKADAIKVAKFFVEMLGSYSADSQFQNIVDLQPMMTDSMVAWSNDFMARNLAKLESSQEKITTKVMQVEKVVVNDNIARINLVTRRSKSDNTGESNFSQSAEVDLVKIQGNWKVDNLVWK